ncbi:MAG TPA: hypothetical protein VIF34_02705 [Methylocystis sp.]|jgi:hypothetical protein
MYPYGEILLKAMAAATIVYFFSRIAFGVGPAAYAAAAFWLR